MPQSLYSDFVADSMWRSVSTHIRPYGTRDTATYDSGTVTIHGATYSDGTVITTTVIDDGILSY